jgi:hypothetical protein
LIACQLDSLINGVTTFLILFTGDYESLSVRNDGGRVMHIRRQPLTDSFIASGIGLLVGVSAVRFSPALALGGLLGAILFIWMAKRPELGLLIIVFITGNLVDPMWRVG